MSCWGLPASSRFSNGKVIVKMVFGRKKIDGRESLPSITFDVGSLPLIRPALRWGNCPEP